MAALLQPAACLRVIETYQILSRQHGFGGQVQSCNEAFTVEATLDTLSES